MGIEPFETKKQTEKNNNKNTHSNKTEEESREPWVLGMTPPLASPFSTIHSHRICHVVYPALDFPLLFV